MNEGTHVAIARLANGKTFGVPRGATLLDAAKAAGLVLEHSCKTGRCSSCKARVLEGVTQPIQLEDGLSSLEQAAGWILTCARTASSNVVLDVEDLGELADYPARIFPCRIQSLERLTPDVMRIRLRLPPTANFRFLAGQYINVMSPQGPRRSYSIANGNAAHGLELHVRAMPDGLMSNYWFERAKVNDLLRLEGPFGTFFMRDSVGDDVVFLATGTGIAPVQAMLERSFDVSSTLTARSVSVYWGNRRVEDHYWNPDTLKLPIHFVPVVSRPSPEWRGCRGHVQDVYLSTQPDLSRTWVYACGSNEMIEVTRFRLQREGLPGNRFRSDAFVTSGDAIPKVLEAS